MQHYDLSNISLNSGRRISVQVGKDVQLVVRSNSDTVVAHTTLPYPLAGLAGGYLLASPSERYLLMSIFSGQSEEGYELFDVSSDIRHLSGCQYLKGEAATYCFSPDESSIIMTLPYSSSEWWQPWDDDDMELDEDGRRYFDFGLIQQHRIGTNKITRSIIRIFPPEQWVPNRNSYSPCMKPKFLNSDKLSFTMPWGTEQISLPLPEIIELSP
ncbi:MAG: hypothetical protein OEZ68_20220 [Gammaproteobacteria bacterium]|nr:hypothetical protein [Gammaproteobacteria bacterium]MDH5803130.1 hypothetical protein [Gammaproteobacteria bacterium]